MEGTLLKSRDEQIPHSSSSSSSRTEEDRLKDKDINNEKDSSYSSHPGVVSLTAFILGNGLSIIYYALGEGSLSSYVTNALVYGATGVVALVLLDKTSSSGGSRYIIKESDVTALQVQLRAFFLGWGFSCGVKLVQSDLSVPFGLYACLMSIFHFSEFLVTSVISPDTLSLDSFLLTHSREYGVAALASVLEYFVELYFVPGLKDNLNVTMAGMGVCLFGEFLRKWAMLSASKNFTHLVRDTKADGQYLVTSGPYAMCRHPGYAGWFWWSIGTQIVMVNPLCILAYSAAVYRFFRGRIYYEEVCLLSFYGLDYIKYQKDVPRTGVPFVAGYLPSTPAPSLNEEDDSSSGESTFHKVEHDQLEEDD